MFEYFRIYDDEIELLKNAMDDDMGCSVALDGLNCLGRDGWELVDVVSSNRTVELEYFFKRIGSNIWKHNPVEYICILDEVRKNKLSNSKKKYDIDKSAKRVTTVNV